MTKEKNILSSDPGLNYVEEAPEIKAGEFQKVIDSRRAVRIFEEGSIPDYIVERCLGNGLLAPNSSNLQPWEIYWVRDSEKRRECNRACLSQVAAKSAAELIIVTARVFTWKRNAREMLNLFGTGPGVPKLVLSYYGKTVPFVYSQGPFSLWGFIKRIIFFFRGLAGPVIREPVSRSHMKMWAVKSTALAAENIMLSFRAYGYDSCPMEGFDSKRIRRILSLPRDAVVVMVIAAGKRAPGGIYGPRIRFDRSRFIKKV